jgi:hypothetical protein
MVLRRALWLAQFDGFDGSEEGEFKVTRSACWKQRYEDSELSEVLVMRLTVWLWFW